mgnify:CR=1 FL=1
MKKTIAVLFAVMMMLLSAVPAFAAASPEPSTFKYKVEIIPTEGGDGDYKFTTGIDEKGEQHVFIEPLPYDGSLGNFGRSFQNRQQVYRS